MSQDPLRDRIETWLGDAPGSETLRREVSAYFTDDDTDLRVGARVGPYALREHLGSGGMGAVFAAERLEDSTRVALKVVARDAEGPAKALRNEAARWCGKIKETAESASHREDENRKTERALRIARELSNLVIYCRSVVFNQDKYATVILSPNTCDINIFSGRRKERAAITRRCPRSPRPRPRS